MEVGAHASASCSFLVSAWFISRHLRSYSSPPLQVHILRILLMVPVVAFSSWLALLQVQSAASMEALRSCYEGYALYEFKLLIVEYLGGEHRVLDLLEEKRRIDSPFCVGPKKYALTVTFYRRVSQGILQFVVMRPVSGLLGYALDRFSLVHENDSSLSPAFLTLAFINNLSVSVSLCCLALLYGALHEHLQPHYPLQKFLCVKGLLFFAFWQGCLIELLQQAGVIPDPHQCDILQNTMLCYESLFFAFAFSYSFSSDEFEQPINSEPIIKSIKDVLSVNDVIKDFNSSFITSSSTYNTELEPLEDAPLITNLSTCD